MDIVGDKEKIELENRNEDPMNFAPSPSVDWRFGGLVPTGNPMAISKGSTSMVVESFGPTLWDQSQTTNSQNLGGLFCDINNNVQNSASTSDIRKGLTSIDHKTFDMGWNPAASSSSMLNLKGGGGIFLPGNGLLPQSSLNLSQFPADSAFIERAARFSCFNVNDGNFSDMVNPLDSMGINYSRGGGGVMMQEVFAGNGQSHSQKNVDEAFKDVSLSVVEHKHEHEHGATGGGGSPLKNGRSHDEAKQGIGVGGSGPGNDSDEPELFSTAGGQDEPSVLEGTTDGEPFAGGLDSKKRRRSGQDTELDLPNAKVGPQQPGDSAKDKTEIQHKGDQNPTSTTNKSSGKHGKQSSQASEDPPKEEYIHIRARRGQATNSHSLAERVRREKISERMKFLQDLVPGCSKVTGKAVMLDEIINYVQSLQRQVEFLSMKLATVNPRLDFNVEGLLAKDILQSRAGPSTLGFSPDMAYPLLHSSQQGLIRAGLSGMGSSSDLHRRTINSQLTPMTGGFKEPTQLPNVWEDELHNIIQMSYGTSAPPNGQDADGSLPPGHMKVEL